SIEATSAATTNATDNFKFGRIRASHNPSRVQKAAEGREVCSIRVHRATAILARDRGVACHRPCYTKRATLAKRLTSLRSSRDRYRRELGRAGKTVVCLPVGRGWDGERAEARSPTELLRCR